MKRWGPWFLDSETYELVNAVEMYRIDLESCTNSAEMLDWIMQIAGKSWGDNDTLAGLVRAFNAILHPQSRLCGLGHSKRMTKKTIRELVEAV